jgi:hypothetical protein
MAPRQLNLRFNEQHHEVVRRVVRAGAWHISEIWNNFLAIP